jgi:hypothetical protein
MPDETGGRRRGGLARTLVEERLFFLTVTVSYSDNTLLSLLFLENVPTSSYQFQPGLLLRKP